MKNTPKSKSTIVELEQEVATLQARQVALDTRRSDAVSSRDGARAARKAALAADTSGDITKHTRAVRDAEDEVETIDSVLADLTAQLADAESRLGKAREMDKRSAAAGALEAMAGQLAGLGKELDVALAAVGNICAEIETTIPDTITIAELPETLSMQPNGPHFLSEHRGSAKPADLVRLVLAEGLARAFRPSFAAVHVGGSVELVFKRVSGLGAFVTTLFGPETMAEETGSEQAIKALVIDRLTARAEAIRNGELPADLHDRGSIAPKPAPVAVKGAPIKIVARETFNFRDDEGLVCYTGLEVHELTSDVAQTAITAGLAYRIGTAPGDELWDQICKGQVNRSRTGVKMELVRQPDGTIHSVEANKSRMPATVTRLNQSSAA